MWNRHTHYCTVTTPTLFETVVHIIVLSRLTHYAKLLYTVLYCHDSHIMWNCCAEYCTVTSHTKYETVVHFIVPSLLYRMLFNYAHTRCETFVDNNVLSRSAQKAKPFCIILYYHEANTIWKLGAENFTVTTNTRCETFVQNIVLSRFTHALSGWLLLNVNSAIFHLYYGENKLIFNDMMMRSALFYGASSQKQQSKDRHVALLGHIILIRTN